MKGKHHKQERGSIMENTEIVNYLSYLVKSYDRVTKVIAQTRQTGMAYGLLVDDADDDCDLLLKGKGKEVGMLKQGTGCCGRRHGCIR